MNKKFILLAAGPNKLGIPLAGVRADLANSFLDWQLHLAQILECQHIDYVTGYKTEDLSSLSTKVHYLYNPHWQTAGALSSLLLCDFPADQALYILYGDVVLHTRWLQSIKENFTNDKMTFFLDSSYPQRYRQQPLKGETLALPAAIQTDQATPYTDKLLSKKGEFVGFLHIPASCLKFLKTLPEGQKCHLSQLIQHWHSRGYPLQVIDAQNRWCDLNIKGDLARFSFGSKAQTLSNLEQRVTQGKILAQISFNQRQWLAQTDTLLAQITAKFANKKIVVRSSAVGEDSFESSQAGAYLSLLNVAADPVSLSLAINQVFDSYHQKDADNQVLIQPQIENLALHAVIHTRSYQGGPYYVLNYLYGNDSSSLTAGLTLEHSTLVVHKKAAWDTSSLIKETDIIALLRSAQELESHCLNDALDIELAMDKAAQVYILQVRPLVIAAESQKQPLLASATIESSKKQYRAWQEQSPLWGMMPDWNPAEMIGRKPEPLAYSCYHYLVTEETWARQRTAFGYTDLRGRALMRQILGSPYIDIKASFLSFTPAKLSSRLRNKVVNSALQRLQQFPQLHDKVEFSVIPTAYRFDFSQHYQWLFEQAGTTVAENKELQDCYKELTWRILLMHQKSSMPQLPELPPLASLQKLSDWELLEKAMNLLAWCRWQGVYHFAGLARCAFVAVNLIDSLCRLGVLSQERREQYFSSIHTVNKAMSHMAWQVRQGDASLESFKAAYGHLRPGSYDVKSPRYDSNETLLIQPLIEHATEQKTLPFSWDTQEKKSIEQLLQESGFSSEKYDIREFSRFLRWAICAREEGKFVFSKALSYALEVLALFAQRQQLSKRELAFIDLSQLQALAWQSGKNRQTWLKKCSEEQQHHHQLFSSLESPVLLSNVEQLDVFAYPVAEPNFITNKAITARLIFMSNSTDSRNLQGTVVLLESADPGFDWLFSCGISGLVTLYGGLNSHMAIRCAELQLPAAIGVGEKIFQSLKDKASVFLDAAAKKVLALDRVS